MKGYVKEMLEEGRCWRQCGKKCPLGKEFLKELYMWGHENYLHPMLSWKICDPCELENQQPKPDEWRKYL